MTEQAVFTLKGRNPDVLTCIANLSNDEVFTPPEFANRMLDTLAEGWAAANGGADIWADSTVTFLDPCTKSGVFLREIATRLIKGLEGAIPDLQARVDHILTKQLFGIGITRLTALLARRSLYCSKHATGPHSVAKGFSDNDNGNIWFERTEHVREGDRCRICGAGKTFLDRGPDEENHAYAFIHSDDIQARLGELFGGKMHFDVIIGNPPYQLSDASASASASPIYHKFIEQAMKLEPRFLSMVTPSRWFVGGKGLDDFRSRMLADRRLRVIVDFIVDKDAFPNVNVNGGLNYFLWDRDNLGDCAITTIERGGTANDPVVRSLNEFDVLVRRDQATKILRKVTKKDEGTFDARVSSRKPFGLPTNFFGAATKSASKPVKLHSSGKTTWVSRSEITANREWVDEWKVLIGRATDGNENYPLPVWDQRGPFVSGPGEACSETYLVAALTKSKSEAERVCAYMSTIFFRFLVSLRKITQDNKADVFAFVPDLPTDRLWTDDALCERYGLTHEERDFMRSLIREMTFAG
jgi:site-specific DNA-methyltransferase (adenine-specific)